MRKAIAVVLGVVLLILLYVAYDAVLELHFPEINHVKLCQRLLPDKRQKSLFKWAYSLPTGGTFTLGEGTSFEWDTAYYCQFPNQEFLVKLGLEPHEFTETTLSGINYILFVKDNRVVCDFPMLPRLFHVKPYDAVILPDDQFVVAEKLVPEKNRYRTFDARRLEFIYDEDIDRIPAIMGEEAG